MCGIVGLMRRNPGKQPYIDANSLSKLTHRGPDGEGVFSDEFVSLGHRRLSIIDLSENGGQPMTYADGRFVVTFNGEIYNYLELKTELKSIGESFRSSSDTEVLLASYKVWGEKCVNKFRGMFAFAIYDKKQKSLFMSRDRCGEKPFFYYMDDDYFYFASELKALLPLLPFKPRFNPSIVDMYLHYQYVPEPFTLLYNIHKLPAAHVMTVSPGSWLCRPARYWNIEDIEYNEILPKTEPDIFKKIQTDLEDAVKMTLRSDVPVGVALSGGIDSGAIAALAQKNYPEPMHAFCVGYPGRPPYDERDQAIALAKTLGMIVHEIEIPVDHFVDFFPSLVRIMDEPIADPAAFGHFSVPKAASDLGIKVLLTGIGGDEVFWGYSWTSDAVALNFGLITKTSYRIKFKEFIKSLIQRDKHAFAKPNYYSFLPEHQLHFFPEKIDFWNTFEVKDFVYGDIMLNLGTDNPFIPTDIVGKKAKDIPSAIIRLLFETWLVSNCLSLGDRVSMGVGVESRLPFLDVNLIENIMAIRKNKQDYMLGQKAWLRAALKNILPDEVLVRPKAGFQPPVFDWISGIIMTYGESLYNGELIKQGIIDTIKLKKYIRKICNNFTDMFFIYKLVLLETWYNIIVRG